ncbi:MAG TPA: 50S ribosomal protein L21e [Candidatus Bathyarchaeia archaeon]|jgi:large subunit ribosomal protein L21e|nr:50S ribosomal protein L21e [Candidatus Bathyarchaeia archaeon]
MKKSKGYRRGTRKLAKIPIRESGKPKITKLLIEHQVGDMVIVKIDSSTQKSIPHRRFHGKIGKVLEHRGRGYVVSVPQGNAVKQIIARSEHLEAYKGS